MKDPGNPIYTPDAQFRLARAWQVRGKLDRAIEGYRKILAEKPDHLATALKLGNLMQEHGRLSEVMQIFQNALEADPNESRFHKHFVNALVGQGGIEDAFRYYQLVRQDEQNIEIVPEDILCCVVVRNEAVRLPYFLSYYRQKGVAKFLVVDNGSTDGSLEFLLDQPDVYVWQSDLAFNKANFGSAWFEVLLRKYGVGHWCLTVDADELLYYHNCEDQNLIELCQELDRKKKRALGGILLDMYADKPIKDTHYEPGQDFLPVCPYFDRQFYHTAYENGGPFNNQTVYFGGVRERVFGKDGEYYLSKVPLINYDLDIILAGGQHWTNLPAGEIAAQSGALLHFKYFSSFHAYVAQESKRQEHYGEAMQYKQYVQGLEENQDLMLYDPAHSIKLESSQQLVDLGIMQIDPSEMSANRAIEFPRIDPLPDDTDRPMWSVMITAYRRLDYLAQAINSVLAQAPAAEEMQIEVVVDGPSHEMQDQMEALVKEVAGERVVFTGLTENAGHPEIFNVCLRRARGEWVHLLHDDDWVAPGFYAALQSGIEQAPNVGAAFCRHAYVDESGRQDRLSWLERDTAGTIDNWLDRIGVFCRLQTPSIVVRRAAYEQAGGYCAQAQSTFDWEMWQRLAVHYPFWFEPQTLAFFREHSTSESSILIKSGRQIADVRRVIGLAQSYLPNEVKGQLSKKAREYHARYALDVAQRQIEKGDHAAAMRNIREGLKCSQSRPVTQALVSLLMQSEEDSDGTP